MGRTFARWQRGMVLLLALAGGVHKAAAADPAGDRPYVSVQFGPAAEFDIASAIGGFVAVRVPAQRWFSLVGVVTGTHSHAWDVNDPPGDTLSTATVAAYAQFSLVPRHTVSPFLRTGFGRLIGSQRRSSAYSSQTRVYWDEHRRGTYFAIGVGADVRLRPSIGLTMFLDGGAGGVTKRGYYDIPGIEHRETSSGPDFFLLAHAGAGVRWMLP